MRGWDKPEPYEESFDAVERRCGEQLLAHGENAGRNAMALIEQDTFLSFLYERDILVKLFMSILCDR